MVEKRYAHGGEDIVLRYRENAKNKKHTAWFDDGGTAVYLESAYRNKDKFPQWLQDEMSDKLVNSSLDELQDVLEFLAENNLLVCSCGRLFPKDNAVSTGFAGVKCGVCSSDDSHCPETEDNTHNMTVTSGRNNARRPTKRKCTACGYTTQTPPTG